jgi:hypothetical protein
MRLLLSITEQDGLLLDESLSATSIGGEDGEGEPDALTSEGGGKILMDSEDGRHTVEGFAQSAGGRVGGDLG